MRGTVAKRIRGNNGFDDTSYIKGATGRTIVVDGPMGLDGMPTRVPFEMPDQRVLFRNCKRARYQELKKYIKARVFTLEELRGW